MAFDSRGLFSAMLLNLIISPILLGILYVVLNKPFLWKVFRPMRPQGKSLLFSFGGEKNAGFVNSLIRLVDPMIDVKGSESGLYLSFLRLLVPMFWFVGFLLLAGLVPMNVTDNYREKLDLKEDGSYQEAIDDFTTRNIHPESSRLWLMTMLSFFVAYELWSMFLKMAYTFQVAKAKATPPTTARVEGVPRTTEEEAAKHVWSMVPPSLRSRVTHMEFPRKEVKDMIKTIQKHDDAVAALEHWYAVCEKLEITGDDRFSHKDVMCRKSLFSCEKVNALTHFREKVDKYHNRLQDMKKQIDEQPLTGDAFVTFENAGWCATFVISHQSALIGAFSDSVTFANKPKAIIWSNAGASNIVQIVGSIIVAAILVFLALIWASLLGAVGNIETISKYAPWLESVLDVNTELKGLITTYLPIIAVAVANILLPVFMRALTVYVEKVDNKVDREKRVQRKLTAFIIVTCVLLQAPLMGGNDVDIMGGDVGDPLQFVTIMIAPTGGYFVGYVLTAGFMGNLIRAMRIGDMILKPLKASRALTKRELTIAHKRKPFKFSEQYAFALLAIAFSISFAPNVPYIPIFGFFFFLIRFLVDRTALVDIYPKSRESDYCLFPTAVNTMHVIVLCMQVFSVMTMNAIKERWDCMGVSVLPILGSLFIIYHTVTRMNYYAGAAYIRDRMEGNEIPKVLNLPSLLDLLAGGMSREHTPVPIGDVSADCAALVKAALEEEKTPVETIPDLSSNGPSAYEHTIKAYKLVVTDHDDMAAKPWYFTHKSKGEGDEASDAGGPFRGVVISSIFFSNADSEECKENELEMKKKETAPFGAEETA